MIFALILCATTLCGPLLIKTSVGSKYWKKVTSESCANDIFEQENLRHYRWPPQVSLGIILYLAIILASYVLFYIFRKGEDLTSVAVVSVLVLGGIGLVRLAQILYVLPLHLGGIHLDRGSICVPSVARVWAYSPGQVCLWIYRTSLRNCNVCVLDCGGRRVVCFVNDNGVNLLSSCVSRRL